MDTNDSLLLEKMKKGDAFAFDAFFMKYYKLLLANAFFYMKDEQEAKDIVQDFFFEFWQKKMFLKMEGDMKGYLFRSIQNRCFNIQRRKMQEKQTSLYVTHNEASVEDCPKESERQFVLLLDAINHLPQQRKAVLHQIYFGRKKYQEAADELGISLNTVKTHLKIGLKFLREKLGKK